MPKEYKERRIDIEPPRFLVTHTKRDVAEVAVPADNDPPAFPEPEPESPIDMIFEFSGGGAAGSSTEFEPPVPLASGDLYLVAYAYSNGTTSGGVSISPSAVWWYGSSSGSDRAGVTTFKVDYTQAGAASFTVTVVNGPTAYHGWILRGVQTGFSEPLLDSAHDEGLVSYTASGVYPAVCENPVTRTDWYGAAVVAAPAYYSFGVYAASARIGPCDEDAPLPTVFGGGSSASSGVVDGAVGYEFGTVSGGAGSITVDATSGRHGTWAGVTLFSVGALAE